MDHDDHRMDAAGGDVVIRLSRDEALVLSGFFIVGISKTAYMSLSTTLSR